MMKAMPAQPVALGGPAGPLLDLRPPNQSSRGPVDRLLTCTELYRPSWPGPVVASYRYAVVTVSSSTSPMPY